MSHSNRNFSLHFPPHKKSFKNFTLFLFCILTASLNEFLFVSGHSVDNPGGAVEILPLAGGVAGLLHVGHAGQLGAVRHSDPWN